MCRSTEWLTRRVRRAQPPAGGVWAPPSASGFRGARRAAAMRSTLAFCGATFVAGVAVFGGALLLHTRYDLYGANRLRPSASRNDRILTLVARKRARDARDDG